MSECLATLITFTVDPALPDLLTRRGPLAFVHTQHQARWGPGRAPWKYVLCCRRWKLPAYPVQYLYGTQLRTDVKAAILWDISEETSY